MKVPFYRNWTPAECSNVNESWSYDRSSFDFKGVADNGKGVVDDQHLLTTYFLCRHRLGGRIEYTLR